MSKVIFRADASVRPADLPVPGQPVTDGRGRPLRDMRISVTDRCNFRCTYCMPRDIFGGDYRFMPQNQLLNFAEITRLARIAVDLGIEKIRLTGGEPLLRKDLHILVGMLAQLTTPAGKPIELTLTTNATLLAKRAQALKDAGLHRVTVSLDALDESIFQSMSDSQLAVRTVLDGIEKAAQVGLAPVKVNMVVRKGLNEHQILPMARYFRGTGQILRFIEFMDVGATNGWDLSQVVTGQEIIQQIQKEFPLQPQQSHYRGEVAARWKYQDGAGEIGVITSVSQPFCGDCTRIRLSPEGKLFTCLFASQGHDMRAILRNQGSDHDLAIKLASVWSGRSDQYSEIRGQQTIGLKKIEMSYIGG